MLGAIETKPPTNKRPSDSGIGVVYPAHLECVRSPRRSNDSVKNLLNSVRSAQGLGWRWETYIRQPMHLEAILWHPAQGDKGLLGGLGDSVKIGLAVCGGPILASSRSRTHGQSHTSQGPHA